MTRTTAFFATMDRAGAAKLSVSSVGADAEAGAASAANARTRGRWARVAGGRGVWGKKEEQQEMERTRG